MAAPSASDIELRFYEQFFIAQNLEPYPVQERAFDHIFRGESVLVTVPTGTGKTMMAKAAIFKARQLGQTAVYTTPLRALTEEKFRELSADFGAGEVGFATGDYKVNPEAPIQVVVAEILWNRIFGDRVNAPADVVIMDEGHYFNDPERGYVWEQSIIGLDPRSQLVILSATVGDAERFCQWVNITRRVEMQLVQSLERKVPLFHEYREQYLVEVARELVASGDVPVIIFGFGREQCFERARLLKSCPRFTTDEERQRIAIEADAALLDRGLAKDLKPLLLHGIGVHHAGILPRYKQLVEKLTLERLVKFVVSTETIAAGINLPAKRVVFPELRKYVQKKARLVNSAEYHQMAGRAGRPQFDTEGIAIVLAPELVVQEVRKEIKESKKGGYKVDEARIWKGAYSRAKAEAQKNNDVTWAKEDQDRLVAGKPASLRSQTRITAEQILAIGLPDLTREALPGALAVATPEPAADGSVGTEDSAKTDTLPPELLADALVPASMNLNIRTVIDHLLLDDRERWGAHKRLAQVTANLQALGVINEHGEQIAGRLINELRGIDGLFVYYAMMNRDMGYPECREFVEYLIDHDVIQRMLDRKDDDKKREWIKNKLREMRAAGLQAAWDDAQAEYDKAYPRPLTPVEQLHAEFLARLPHPELHGGKKPKNVFAKMEEAQQGFMDLVEQEGLQNEEGNLFSYLVRVMKFAKMLHEATTLDEFAAIEESVRDRLAVIDPRVVSEIEGRKKHSAAVMGAAELHARRAEMALSAAAAAASVEAEVEGDEP